MHPDHTNAETGECQRDAVMLRVLPTLHQILFTDIDSYHKLLEYTHGTIAHKFLTFIHNLNDRYVIKRLTRTQAIGIFIDMLPGGELGFADLSNKSFRVPITPWFMTKLLVRPMKSIVEDIWHVIAEMKAILRASTLFTSFINHIKPVELPLATEYVERVMWTHDFADVYFAIAQCKNLDREQRLLFEQRTLFLASLRFPNEGSCFPECVRARLSHPGLYFERERPSQDWVGPIFPSTDLGLHDFYYDEYNRSSQPDVARGSLYFEAMSEIIQLLVRTEGFEEYLHRLRRGPRTHVRFTKDYAWAIKYEGEQLMAQVQRNVWIPVSEDWDVNQYMRENYSNAIFGARDDMKQLPS